MRRDIASPRIEQVRVRGLDGLAFLPEVTSSDESKNGQTSHVHLGWHEEGATQLVTVTIPWTATEAAIDEAFGRGIAYAEAFEVADDKRLFTFLVGSFEARHFWGPLDARPEPAIDRVRPPSFPGC